MAFWFQYSVGPSIVHESGWVWKTYRAIPGTGKLVYRAWTKGCDSYEGDLLSQCAGNAGVYRSMFLTTLFFILAAIASNVQPSLNREAWPAKYAVFFFSLLICVFVPNAPLFTGFYLWFARIGATVALVLQQVILIDIAYNWNDDWVDMANDADRISYGSGSGWLKAIVGTCVFMYSGAIVGISFLYHYFDGCPENIWIITLTLLGIIAMTAVQLSGSEGSLLTSGIISLYAVYLCFSTVSKNPNGQCNPRLGHNDVVGIVMGLTLTAISLAWTGWAWSAEQRLSVDNIQSTKAMSPSSSTNNTTSSVNLDVPFLNSEAQPTQGIVMEQTTGTNTHISPDLWKLNVIMALTACFVAMILTGWGTVQELNENQNAANPTVGRVNMAMIGVSQWTAILLYMWTLLAPRLFPDRDFS
mmetsp:Transcript_8666/g.12583  ORF Transcript_8666/g.12583 Transcript_8666/m.12583 type:complete len:414 (-) Transcript_8666:190-1431(-)|eukprot:CAMPEP_0202445382 /NCGR_PEP_ID=MMETSP1360-20130828/4212_1 /ASSEMBLY_ACC=CAM_ASM_000848 /TAXON_ID=515479 /ORGANISM="Licmophora paradoxa, Strain CCMP2313" /LENGTH=413 /DNA_ID=CAMNT_0049061631 /DNA_START=231 /DNA_END=1472 /DNA_ORIENTATION=-